MIDESQSMLTDERLQRAIKAAQAVINSANPNDHVCLIKCLLLPAGLFSGPKMEFSPHRDGATCCTDKCEICRGEADALPVPPMGAFSRKF